MKKVKKFIALLLALTMFVGVNTTYVNADYEKCCELGVLFVEGPEYINCSYGIPHPCYVDGKLVSCQPHYYTYRISYYCDLCGSLLCSNYGYHEIHQYSHN